MDFHETGSAPAVAAPDAGAGSRLRGAALFFVMFGLFLTLFLEALDQTVVGTALPKIVGSLHGFDRYVWTVTAYILMSTVSVPIAGKLSDQFGRKGFLLGGTALFLVGSALSGVSGSMDMLILSRALQGLGAGTGIALATVVIADLFPPEERVKWQSFFGLIYGVSSLVGPTLGGLIADHGPLLGSLVTPATRWRWIFYLNLPLGAAVLVMLGAALPARHAADRRFRGLRDLRRVDFAGALFLAAATTSLLLGLTWASSGHHAWTSRVVLGCFGAAALLGVLFFVVERRAAEPILPLDLFRNAIFASAAVVSLLQMMILVGLIIYLPFFLQVVLGVSATGSGAALTPMNLASVLGAAVGGGLFMALKRHRPITIAASLILCGGSFLLATMTGNTRILVAVLYMALAGLGIGPFFSILTVITQNALPQDRLGIGTSALRYMGQLGSVLGAALVGTVVNGGLTAHLGPELSIRHGFATVFIVSLAMLAATLFMREHRLTREQNIETLG